MNLVESSGKEKDNKTNKIMIGIGIIIAILVVVSIILFIVIGQLKADQFKFLID